MNWIAFGALAFTFLLAVISGAFFTGGLANRTSTLEKNAEKKATEDDKRRAEDNAAHVSRISEVAKAGERDDGRMAREFEKLEKQIASGFEVSGERIGRIGLAIELHDKRISKLEFGAGIGSSSHVHAQRPDPRRDPR